MQLTENVARHWQHQSMDYNQDKVDEMVLALLFLTLHEGGRAWKGRDREVLGRLYQKGT